MTLQFPGLLWNKADYRRACTTPQLSRYLTAMGKGIQKPRTMYAFEYNENIVPARPAVAMTLRKPKSLCYDFLTRSTKTLKSAATVYCSGFSYPSCHVAGSSPQADLPTAVLFRGVATCFNSQLNLDGNTA